MRPPSFAIGIAFVLAPGGVACAQATGGIEAQLTAIRSRPGAIVLPQLNRRPSPLPSGPSVSLEPNPPKVGQDDVTARVDLVCRTDGSGLQDCTVTGAEPTGRGFDALSIK